MESTPRWCALGDGLQIPLPYYLTFFGTVPTENLEEEFPKQFPGFSLRYVQAAIRIGRLKIVEVDKRGVRFAHTVHRHEPPIPLVRRISIVRPKCTGQCEQLAESLLAISKPNGIPVHGSGRYHRNTIVSLLKAANLNGVNPIHRIDCGTSGVLLLGKSGAPKSLVSSQMEHRKLYVARVSGRFPERLVVESPIYCADKRRNVYACDGGGEDAKPARTVFRRLHYLPTVDESIIECELHSGRTHQIRVHLCSVGFSIVNDLKYQGTQRSELLSHSESTSGSFIDLSPVFCTDVRFEKDEICEECEFSECSSPELFCLHSWMYEIMIAPGQSIAFEAPLPSWAMADC